MLPHSRYGVVLTPIMARLFDAILAQPGATRETLAWIIYGDKSGTRQATIGVHAKNLRSCFERHPLVTFRPGRATYGYRIEIRKPR